jgi:hypothetical protein
VWGGNNFQYFRVLETKLIIGIIKVAEHTRIDGVHDEFEHINFSTIDQ